MKINNFCYLISSEKNIKIGSQFDGFVVTKIETHENNLLIYVDYINYNI